MKELLDLLEERVTSLLGEVDAVRQENTRLRQDLTEKAGLLAEENATLKEALAQERNARESAANRIDALLQRLAKHTPD
jgi:cell division protein ZapB